VTGDIADICQVKTVVLTSAAAKQLDALPTTVAADIETALALYAVAGLGDVKRLHGRDGYRLRVGRYRIIFGDDGMTVLAITIGKRDTTTYR
jgi:mRNA interferase RelE/StbE